jgi:hypothetical protein
MGTSYSDRVDIFPKHRVLQEVISEDGGTAFQALQFIKSLGISFQTLCTIVLRAQVMVMTGE